MEIIVKINKCNCGYWEYNKICSEKDCPRFKAIKKQFDDLEKIKDLSNKLDCKIYVKS